jgi:outer membrane protein assembly factor BamA
MGAEKYVYRSLLFLILHIGLFIDLHALSVADSAVVIVDSITVEGNRKTRKAFMLRELEFAPGDTLSAERLPALLERNALRLMNLSVFTDAKINIRRWDKQNHLHLHIVVKEAWYFYPAPVLEFIDRNFNVWWKEFNRDLDRINYGLDLTQLNLTGRADNLKASLVFGYTNRYAFSYRRPGLNRQQTLGLETGFSLNRAREVNYRTIGDKPAFFRDNSDFQIRRLNAYVRMVWRPKLYGNHVFAAEFFRNQVADTIANHLNPDFFLDGQLRQRHLTLQYRFNFDNVDIRPFPLQGWWLEFELRQNGLLPGDNFRLFRSRCDVRKYTSFNRWLSLEAIVRARLSLPQTKPPYYNNQAIGYGGETIRGYEFYVSDGLNLAVLKTSWRFELLNRSFNLGKLMPLESYKKLPLKIYLSAHGDVGRSHDRYYTAENNLVNRTLFGYGLGLNIIGYYDKVARFEYSFNSIGQRGFFININAGI